jgi:hypothetical protein
MREELHAGMWGHGLTTYEAAEKMKLPTAMRRSGRVPKWRNWQTR